MNKKILLLLPALTLLFTACQKGNNDNPSKPADSASGQVSGVTGVEVDHETLALQVGQTAKLSASVKPISLDDREVIWSSDHPEIASVDASGMVTANKVGSAKIKAAAHADPTKFVECPVTVTGRKVTVPLLTVADIMASTEELKLGANQKNAGGYYFFKGSVDDNTRGETSNSWAEGVAVKLEETAAGASTYYVTFNKDNAKKYFEMDDKHHFAVVDTPTAGREWSWNETYATVQRTISGTTYLPGTYNSFTTVSGCDLAQAANDFFFQFVYQADPVAPTAITVKSAADKIYQGGTLQMEAVLAPAAAEGNVVWSVTGDDKVTINKDGLLSAAADATLNGKVTVKATYDKDDKVFGTKEITVAEVINYGTLEAPLNIAQAKAVIDKFPAGSLTNEKIFVKGFVTLDHLDLNEKDKRADLWLANDDGTEQKAFELFSVYADASLFPAGATSLAANSLVGKEVIAEGWGTVFKGTYEFSNKNADGDYDNGYVRAITTNTRTATGLELNPKETFEITQGEEIEASAALLPYGAAGAITITVTPANQGVKYENGKVVVAADATAGSYTLSATSGSFNKSVTFTVKAAAVSYQTVGVLSFNKDTTVTINNELSASSDPKITYSSTAGVSIVVRKNTSSNDVNVWKADYASCRWYVGHKITISHANAFDRIVFTCDGSYNAFKAKTDSGATTIAALEAAGITYTAENGKIILDFSAAVKTFDLVPDKQIRPSNVELLKKA